MTIDTLLSLLNTSALWTVALGAAGLGLVAGAVGAFAVLRRQSLQGDVVSHAALPGVAVAFMLGGESPAALVVGGAAAGWVAMLLVGVVSRRSRVPFDAALGGALAVFFGLGLVLMTYIQRHPETFPDAYRSPLDRYLFGQAALIRENDLKLIGAAGAAALLILAAVWKELKLLSFDPDYAASLGLPVRRLDLLLTTLTVVAVVIGLKAVGVVLMTALLIAPAAAARQWTDRLGRMVLLSGLFGALAGLAGTVFSHLLSDLPGMKTVPTGPTIVLCATALVVVSLLFGTARGLVWEFLRTRRRRGANRGTGN
jgi:manganese/zinc/iron transport system permease protein